MPKLPSKSVPSGMCVNCRINASWFKSTRQWCYWCEKEQTDGNQSIQRSTGVLSTDSKRATAQKNNKRGASEISSDEDESSFTDDLSYRKQSAGREMKHIRHWQNRNRKPKAEGPF